MEMESGKLFVGGIPWDTTEERLTAYFQTFGDVVEAVVMKDRTTGRTRGFGFVVFSDPSVAERVVKEKHTIDGRTVEAKKAVPREDQYSSKNNGSIQSPQSTMRTKKIFVGGLPSSITESDFKGYFDQFGAITDVVVMYDHNTQRPRGFGFITYDSEEAVDNVLHKTFHELNGKMVEVKRAVPKELSPGPARSPLGGGHTYGLNRVINFPNAYTQGYNQSPIGSPGVRIMERSSPTGVGRSGYSSLTPSGYKFGPSLDPPMSSNYGGGLSSNVGFGNDMDPFYGGDSNRYIAQTGHTRYASGIGGKGSMLTSVGRSMLENENGFYSRIPGNVTEYVGSITGNNTGLDAALGGGLGTIWGSSAISRQGGMNGGIGNYGQNIVNSATKDVLGTGEFGMLRENGRSSLYKDLTWRSLSPELEERSTPFNYGLGGMVSEAIPNNPLGYVGLL